MRDQNGNKLPPSTVLDFFVSGHIAELEDDYENNTDQQQVIVPGIDLAISIEGDPSGTIPGMLVGQQIEYTIVYQSRNIGTSNICAVHIDVHLATGIDL